MGPRGPPGVPGDAVVVGIIDSIWKIQIMKVLCDRKKMIEDS